MYKNAAAFFALLALVSSPIAHAEAPGANVAAISDDSALLTTSKALSSQRRADAQKLFSTGFELWQAGDFAAAEIAFQQGLRIDPANAQANYYYADCLNRRKARDESRVHYTRTVTFGPGTAEAFKAQAALAALAKPVTVEDMSQEERIVALTGSWSLLIHSTNKRGSFVIKRSGEVLSITGGFHTSKFKTVSLNGVRVDLRSSAFGYTGMFQGELKSPKMMSGFLPGWGPGNAGSTWEATKQ